MTWIKICGITNLEDALVAVEAGADALGFVFYEKSPRIMTADQVRNISDAIPKHIEKVGVFVNGIESLMEGITTQAELTGWQLHTDLAGTPLENALREGGWLTLRSAPPPGRNVYVALPAERLVDDEGFRGLGWTKGLDKRLGGIFIDSGRGDMPGGTGKTFNWPQLQQTIFCMSMNFKVVVAGGLTADNVTEAMRILHPWGVDVSSGVEARPGKKDPEKVRAFIKAVREADKASSN